MPILPDDFGEAKDWRVLPNGVRITRAVFWGDNTEYEAWLGDKQIGWYHVERYMPSDGNGCKINDSELRSTKRGYGLATFHEWVAALKDLKAELAAA